jgi:hypothetical protein
LIEFRDERHVIIARVGVSRLARLLQQPGSEIEALDLVAQTAPPKRTPRTLTASGSTEREQVQLRSLQGDAGDVLDKQAVRELKQRRDGVVQEMNVARGAGELTKADALQRELDWIERTLREGIGKDGQLRAFPEEHERARNTVSKTVWRDVAELQEAMPLLHAHLCAWVHTGYLCWYKPDPDEPWEVAS